MCNIVVHSFAAAYISYYFHLANLTYRFNMLCSAVGANFVPSVNSSKHFCSLWSSDSLFQFHVQLVWYVLHLLHISRALPYLQSCPLHPLGGTNLCCLYARTVFPGIKLSRSSHVSNCLLQVKRIFQTHVLLYLWLLKVTL